MISNMSIKLYQLKCNIVMMTLIVRNRMTELAMSALTALLFAILKTMTTGYVHIHNKFVHQLGVPKT
jgi:hypothetical protein